MQFDDFFREFRLLENYLTRLDGAAEANRDFVGLLKDLKSKGLISGNTMADLLEIWQTRNKVSSARSSEIEISPAILAAFNRCKQTLGI
jgi:hypothetical protein